MIDGLRPDLSIIVVNWNTRDLLDTCLNSVYRTVTLPSFDVWVVDNGSTDGSVEMVRAKYPQAHLLANAENLGFGQACNQAMSSSEGESILILNSDIELTEGAVDATWSLLQKCPSVGAMGCALVGKDGLVQQSFSLELPHGPSIKRHAEALPEGLVDCACVWAAYMLVRRDVVCKVGMFDEDFFMFHEDTDWCWRMLEAGWRIAYRPQVKVKHGCKESTNSLPRDVYYRWLLESECILYRKHLPLWQRLLLAVKRLPHFSIVIGFHRLAYSLTHREAHADRVSWFRAGRAAIPMLWKSGDVYRREMDTPDGV